MPKVISKYFKDMTEKTEQSKKHLPKVIAAKRLKFYKTIGKAHLLDPSQIEINPDDENLSLEGLFYSPLDSSKHFVKADVFDDSLVIKEFKKLKIPQFDLKEYIQAVKWVYHTWFGTNTNVKGCNFYNIMIYILAHARDFNEPAKNLITYREDGSQEIKLNINDEGLTDIFPGNTKYIKSLNKLIAELLQEYDEIKYRRLNLNVTYLVLLISRRIVKSEQEFQRSLQCNKTHENYANLCPNPLDSRLPMLSEHNKKEFEYVKQESLINLILYSYLNSKGKTTKIFKLTCINVMENNGLGLWKLFYNVAKLYNIEDYKLWDVMSNYQHCCQALFTLSDLAHTHKEFRSADPPKTYQLFPFCRLSKQYYHSDLASKNDQNFIACYALSFLIDRKLGLTKSFARNAHWTKSFSEVWTTKGKIIAREIHSKINMLSKNSILAATE